MEAAAPQAQGTSVAVIALLLVSLAIWLSMALLALSVFMPWMRANLSGAPASVFQILGMRLRGVSPRMIIDTVVALVHRGHSHDRHLYYLAETTYLARRGFITSSSDLADAVERQIDSADQTKTDFKPA